MQDALDLVLRKWRALNGLLMLGKFWGSVARHPKERLRKQNPTFEPQENSISLKSVVCFVSVFVFFHFFGKELPNGTIVFKLRIESCSHQMRAGNTILTSAIHLVDKLLNNQT